VRRHLNSGLHRNPRHKPHAALNRVLFEKPFQKSFQKPFEVSFGLSFSFK